MTLNTGLSVTIPNHQLVLPNVGFKGDEHEQSYLNDTRTIMVFDRGGVDSMPSFGQVFLTAAYLHVDNDNKQFTLWEAIPTEDTEIVTVDHTSENEGGETCDGGSGQSSGSPNNAPDDDDDNDNGDGDGGGERKSSSSLSGGAIAGIVIGAVAGTVILFVAGFFLYRRRRRQQQQNAKQISAHNAAITAAHDPQKARYVGKGELPSGQEDEMRAAREARESPMELPGDTSFK